MHNGAAGFHFCAGDTALHTPKYVILKRKEVFPIKQVKRQVYILERTLNGFNLWVEGYAFLVQGNSPVQSNYILENAEDIERAIHSPGQNHLSLQEVEQIRNTLMQR